jgi:transposase
MTLRDALRDLNETKAKLAEREAQVQAATARADALAKELARLQQLLKGAPRAAAAVPMPADQLPLPMFPAPPLPPASEEPPLARERHHTPHGRRRAEGVVDTELTAPTPTACPSCNGALRALPPSTADHFDYVPGYFRRVRVVRPRGACTCCDTMTIADAPGVQALERSIVGNRLASHIIVEKFVDNIPLNRQVARMGRLGLKIGLQTLCNVVTGVAGLVRPLVRAMKNELLAADWAQADDTGMPFLNGTPGESGKGRLWVYIGGGHVLYDFTSTKHGHNPARFLQGFKGALLADGGSEFSALIRQEGILRAGCWAHALRKLQAAFDDDPSLVGHLLGLVGRLFKIEEEIETSSAEERLLTRNRCSAPVLNETREILTPVALSVRPRSPLGEAIQYILNQWAPLTAFLKHAGLPIHNNFSELSLRTPVIGRKNWLFAGSEGGARAAADLLSILGSARLHRLDPEPTLTELLHRLPSWPINRIAELTPKAMAAAGA